jgi:hypothetical protein
MWVTPFRSKLRGARAEKRTIAAETEQKARSPHRLIRHVRGNQGCKPVSHMENLDVSSGTAAFDRSNGFLPIKELGDLSVAANAFGRALLVSFNRYVTNVRDNAPETEREVIRLHLSLLGTCSDIVKGRLHELDREAAIGPAVRAQQGFEPEKIIIE